jgi:hypothetical protein
MTEILLRINEIYEKNIFQDNQITTSSSILPPTEEENLNCIRDNNILNIKSKNNELVTLNVIP